RPTRPGLARARAPAHAGTTRAYEGITNVCRCARPVTGTARRSFDVDDAAGIRAEGAAAPDRGGDEGLVPRLLDERDRAARAPGCSGRAEARTPPDPLRDVAGRPVGRAAVQEERDRGRRRARQVPPARRSRGLRGDGAYGAGFRHALPAGGR